jgi:transcriptional regulator with XRE-family HTH domain
MSEHDPAAVRDWLRLLRRRIGQRRGQKKYAPTDRYSQCDLARKLGLSCPTVKRWETIPRPDCHIRRCKKYEIAAYPLPFFVRVLNVLGQDYGMPPMPPRTHPDGRSTRIDRGAPAPDNAETGEVSAGLTIDTSQELAR